MPPAESFEGFLTFFDPVLLAVHQMTVIDFRLALVPDPGPILCRIIAVKKAEHMAPGHIGQPFAMTEPPKAIAEILAEAGPVDYIGEDRLCLHGRQAAGKRHPRRFISP